MRAPRRSAALLAAVALGAAARAAVPEPTAAPSLARERVGGAHDVAAAPGDSLTSVAARFGVSVAALARANGLASDARLALGQTLHVENPHLVPAVATTLDADAILINVPQRMLFQLRHGAVAAAYPIAAGRATWRTPLGQFAVDARATDKPWVVPRSIQEEMRREGKPVLTIVPPGPENPLGRHWLGLSESSCGIHGTNAPASIYALRTHGCVRLHPDDAAVLYARTPVGEPVTIVYEPLLLGALADGRVCLEVHPDAYRRGQLALARLEALAAANGLTERIDWARAREVLAVQEGVAVDLTPGANGRPCS